MSRCHVSQGLYDAAGTAACQDAVAPSGFGAAVLEVEGAEARLDEGETPRECHEERPLPTDIAPPDIPLEPLSLDEQRQCVRRHALSQTEHREICIATLGYCQTRRALSEVEGFIQGLPEYASESQSPYYLIRGLEAAGGLVRIECDENGEEVTPGRKEGLTEDEVDDLVFETYFETTQAGADVYGELTPQARLEELVSTQSARRDTYCDVLEFCRTPRSRSDIEQLLRGRPILESGSAEGGSLQPSVFIDQLERAGVLKWNGCWVTSEDGEAYLEAHASNG